MSPTHVGTATRGVPVSKPANADTTRGFEPGIGHCVECRVGVQLDLRHFGDDAEPGGLGGTDDGDRFRANRGSPLHRVCSHRRPNLACGGIMPRLHVTNGFSTALPGLGKSTPFPDLSAKRVTRCVREESLRPKYGHHSVQVTCLAIFEGGF